MNVPSPTPTFLAYHWGDAYLLNHVQDRWVALRRDMRHFLVADTLAELENLINVDYRQHPICPDFDSPQDANYLTFPSAVTPKDATEKLDKNT